MNKLPISAFIVSKNEGHLLENCIKSVLFCNELIVVDLKSSDNTVEIAKKYGAKILSIEPLPVIEMIHQKHITEVKNNWVLITDPDEVTSPELAKEINDDFISFNNSIEIGVVDVPLVYYFKSHQLKGTSWGGIKNRAYLIHKDRYVFTSNVHNGRFLKEGFIKHTIENTGKNHIHHYWMQGYKQIFEKHFRYLKNEGKSRFEQGFRTSFFTILQIPFHQFFNCYFKARGFKDGFTGVFLSLFRAWYFTAANIELYKYQKAANKKRSN